MRSRNVLFTLVLLVSIFLFAVFRKWQEPQPKEVLNRAPVQLHFYAFALCRMQCLNVDKDAVRRMLQNGIILMNKSNRALHPCPVFAVQGRTNRDQYIRVIFEQCRNGTYVVNCYNLKQDAACDCTTDYKPNNR